MQHPTFPLLGQPYEDDFQEWRRMNTYLAINLLDVVVHAQFVTFRIYCNGPM